MRAAAAGRIPNLKYATLSHSGRAWRLLQGPQPSLPIAMKHLPTPQRLLNALMPPPGGVPHDVEPVLLLDSLPPLAPEAPAPLPRRVVERVLEEGSRRVYEPRRETEVIESQDR